MARGGTQTAAAPDEERSFIHGARVLSIGIASTGVFTFAYLATASHVLGPADYSRISVCWAIMFVILSVIYRPIEQLLSRTIADRTARGAHGHILRTPALIQTAFALIFLAVSLALRNPIQNDLFGGSAALYWILVIGVLAYAGSYFARGWLAGHKRFALYGALVFLESTSRFLFALAVALGLATGMAAVGLGMAVAPVVSLAVIPFAFLRVGAPQRGVAGVADARAADDADTLAVEAADAGGEGPVHAQLEEAATDLSLRHGAVFAVAVVAIMFSEQTLMNAGVLVVAAGAGFTITSGLAGFVFNVLLIVRAPLQLFQAVQTSILPHLASLEARNSAEAFRHTVRITVRAIAAFAGAVTLGLLAIGPFVMSALLGNKGFHYDRWGLALVGIGMGLHLVSGTLNQALLARGYAKAAAAAWLAAAAAFVAFIATTTTSDQAAQVTRVEIGYCAAAGLLALMLWALYRRGDQLPAIAPAPSSASAQAASTIAR
jgi:O-antigen/teichoic acid export membrane protein